MLPIIRKTEFSWAIDNPSFGANMWGDPVVAYDSLGNLYYENMYGSSTINGCKVMKSTDNGADLGRFGHRHFRR